MRTPTASMDRKRWVMQAVEQYEARLLRFASRLLGDDHAARDAVQHSFLRLCRQPLDGLGDSPGPWLFTVCRNYAVDLLRGRRRTEQTDEGGAADCCDRALDPAAAAERADLCRHVTALVDQLPLPQREALALWSEGFCYREIADITGASEGNVRVIVHRALKRLREHPAMRPLCGKQDEVRT